MTLAYKPSHPQHSVSNDDCIKTLLSMWSFTACLPTSKPLVQLRTVLDLHQHFHCLPFRTVGAEGSQHKSAHKHLHADQKDTPADACKGKAGAEAGVAALKTAKNVTLEALATMHVPS